MYNHTQSFQEQINLTDDPVASVNGTLNVNCLTFNQDASCAALGLDTGYKIFSCKPKVRECYQSKQKESIGLVEMLYCTSLVAVVALGDQLGSLPRKLKLMNTKRCTTICELVFPSTILLVKLSNERMIVLLEEQIYIYDIKSLNLLHTIETSPNLNRLCALSNNNLDTGNSLLAYPSPPRTITHESLLANGINTNGGNNSALNNIQSVSNAPNRIGDAIIFDLTTLQPLAVIEAHKSALSAMCISSDGSLLATASDKGTIVRVFNVKTGSKLYQFRRGTYPTKIFSLSFSKDNLYVLATSSSETIHIFRLGEAELLANKQKKKKDFPKNKSRISDYEIIREKNEDQTHKHLSTLNMDDGDDEDDDEEDGVLEDDGDDSDAERDGDSDDDENDDIRQSAENLGKQRKLSQSSFNSGSNMNGIEDHKEKTEPIIDHNRLSVARIIRRSSQNLGRKAAQKMGDYLPSRFSSILEPTRHFASLKIQTTSKEVKSVAVIESSADEIRSGKPNNNDHQEYYSAFEASSGSQTSESNLIRISVITSEGFYYVYGLDPERGGDCILLRQKSLLGI